jgi:hypothetical protein
MIGWYIGYTYNEGPKGVKWELEFAYFRLGKQDFMHWDWDSPARKQSKMGMGLRFEKDSHWDDGICKRGS